VEKNMSVPPHLVNRIVEGRCVLFAGAGLSCAAGLPNGLQLLKRLINELRVQGTSSDSDCDQLDHELDTGAFGIVADELREKLGPGLFRDAIGRELQYPPGTTATHRLLPEVPFCAVCTTNYDSLIECAYERAPDGPRPPVLTHADCAELAEALQHSRFYILKAHGSLDRIDTVIFGGRDYRSLLHSNQAYRLHLLNLLCSMTILFLGYRLKDDDLSSFLEEVTEAFRGSGATHYAVFEESTVTDLSKRAFLKNYGITVLPWPGAEPGAADLHGFLCQLKDTVCRTPVPQKVSARPQKLDELVLAITTCLESVGYQIDSQWDRGQRIVDLSARLSAGSVNQRVLVRCIAETVARSDLKGASVQLSRDTPQAWVITEQDVPAGVEDRSEGVQVFNLARFLRDTTLGGYLKALDAEVKKDNIPQRYVPVTCFTAQSRTNAPDSSESTTELDLYVSEWLGAIGSPHLLLLGDFGSGKTWFCRHYAHEQMTRYLEDPTRHRLPLLVTLRSFARAESLAGQDPDLVARQLINDTLDQYNLPFVGSAFEAFRKLNEAGKLLLILDGFDEIARRADRETVADNFWRLARLVEDKSRVILTSRTEYFRWAEQGNGIFTSRYQKPRFEVVYIRPFSDNQIRQAIAKRLEGHKGPKMAARIMRVPDLADMARKPVLMELLLAALAGVDESKINNRGQVYLHATNELLRRNVSVATTATSTADKLHFLCELAWDMLKSGKPRIHSSSLPERIRKYFPDLNSEEVDVWEDDLRTRTLLHRDPAGECEFAHKSLAEYFAAFKFVGGIRCLSKEFRTTYCEKDGTPCPFPVGDLPSQETSEHSATDLGISGLDLPPTALALAADMVSREAEDIEELCRIAWEVSGLIGWNAQNLIPFLKWPHREKLVKLLLAKSGDKRMLSGVAWVLGELGLPNEEVKKALMDTIERTDPGDQSSRSAWWEAGFALEKLGVFDSKAGPGEEVIRFLSTKLPGTSTSTSVLKNLQKCYSAAEESADATVSQCDVVRAVQYREEINAGHLWSDVFRQIDFFRDRSDRRAYFAVWLCGHLKIAESLTAIVRATEHEQGSVRNCAAEALGKMGRPTEGVRRALEDLLGDSYYRTRYHAAWSLGELGLTDSLDRLIDAIEVETVHDVKEKMEEVRKALCDSRERAG
jgi:hypothetical protein